MPGKPSVTPLGTFTFHVGAEGWGITYCPQKGTFTILGPDTLVAGVIIRRVKTITVKTSKLKSVLSGFESNREIFDTPNAAREYLATLMPFAGLNRHCIVDDLIPG